MRSAVKNLGILFPRPRNDCWRFRSVLRCRYGPRLVVSAASRDLMRGRDCPFGKRTCEIGLTLSVGNVKNPQRDARRHCEINVCERDKAQSDKILDVHSVQTRREKSRCNSNYFSQRYFSSMQIAIIRMRLRLIDMSNYHADLCHMFIS